ncbi:MAG: TetR/AcrR family transcriptional regulator [Desulfosarcinaceae bacterium]|nr:TetR/AcrR family transcriptional regulator [Desulfosarcinaceae bacterium]
MKAENMTVSLQNGPPASTPRVGRPRSAASHEAILNAALSLLKEKGYRSVTIEGIASTAGVGKQTIYRWWRSKADIILEAFTRHTADQIAIPDCGNLQIDLQRFLTEAFDTLTREAGSIVRGLMSEALLDPNFAAAMRDTFIASRRSALRKILQNGVDRGELSAESDIEWLIDLIYGPMWYRLLNQHAPLDAHFAKQLSALIAGRGVAGG